MDKNYIFQTTERSILKISLYLHLILKVAKVSETSQEIQSFSSFVILDLKMLLLCL